MLCFKIPASSAAWMCAIAGVFALAGSSIARAHNSEWLAGLAQHPTDRDVLVLRYENGFGGLLYSRDGGKSFQIRPSLSFTRISLPDKVPLLVQADGKLAIGLGDGLYEDDGAGCAIAANATLSGWVTEIATHPIQADVSFILTSGSSQAVLRTGLWRRDSNGTIQPIGANETSTDQAAPSYGKPLFFSQSLRVIAREQSTEELRFVEVGYKNTYATATSIQRAPVFRYSDDLGATWVERPLPADPADSNLFLVAVAPGDPLTAIVAIPRTGAQEPPDAVLITKDGGEHFESYIEGITQIGASLVTPDGRLFIADMGWTAPNPPADLPPAGLWFAPRIGDPVERIADYAVSCLGYEATQGALYLCKAHELGLFYPADRSYCRLFKMTDTTSFVSCDGEDFLANTRVADQLCGNWCGPLHYASSPFCADTSCQASARAYDLEAGWVSLPFESAPSCACPADGNADAGGPVRPGCDPDASVDDAAAPTEDSGGPANDEGIAASRDGAVAILDAGEGTEPAAQADDGCACSVRARHRKLPDLAGFGLALWLIRRVRVQRRRTDA